MADDPDIEEQKLDAGLIAQAEKLSSGRGDGRLCRADAEAILARLTEGGSYGAVERDTVAHIRERFDWSEAAAEWFATAVRKWAAAQSRN